MGCGEFLSKRLYHIFDYQGFRIDVHIFDHSGLERWLVVQINMRPTQEQTISPFGLQC